MGKEISSKPKQTPRKRFHRDYQRGTIWLVVDKNKNHNGWTKKFENHVQGGTRTAIIVSNNVGNTYSPNVEVVYTTTAPKPDLPTHFQTTSTPQRSTVQCEAVMTVAKKDLLVCYGALKPEEIPTLNHCLKVSLGLCE